MTELGRRAVLAGIATGAIGLAGEAGATGVGRYVVGTDSPAAKRAARSEASSVVHDLDFGAIGGAVAGYFPAAALDGLRNRADVRYVERDLRVRAIGETLPEGIDRVDADVAHDNGETGAGADIAIIDTGIDADHPDLSANLGTGYSVYDCRGNCAASWGDDNGHGTHCAGIADADHNTLGVVGVSTEATLHAVKVLDDGGSGYFSDVAAGIRWVADQGYDVGSLSLGASRGTSTIRDACQYAYDAGVLLVAAAGNDGPCTDCVGYPAAYDTVVAVSAVDDGDLLASFSSTGPEVELASPGVGVYSTYPDDTYASLSGTSMACPHVSGAGGQLMANGLTNVEARDRLRSTAEDIGLADTEQGAGLLDVEAALDFGGDTSVVVSTGSVSSVGETTATLTGSLDDLGGASSADVSFEWGEAGSGLPNATAPETLSSSGSFSASLDGLASGTDYEFRAVATASDGDTDTGGTASFTTDSATVGDTAPVVDSYTVTEAGSPNPHAEITADWAVSDADGDLSTVTVDVVDSRNRVVASSETPVDGATASGTDSLTVKHARGETFDVVLTVTDGRSNSATATRTVTE